jgi:hypothetical protein
VIIRHQRASSSGKGFRQLARYIRGRSAQPRTTWFLAANLQFVPVALQLKDDRTSVAVDRQDVDAVGARIVRRDFLSEQVEFLLPQFAAEGLPGAYDRGL